MVPFDASRPATRRAPAPYEACRGTWISFTVEKRRCDSDSVRRRPFETMDALLREQLGPSLQQAVEDGEEGAARIALFEVLDERGEHVRDLRLFCGDNKDRRFAPGRSSTSPRSHRASRRAARARRC
jgi:hypothetical protein